MSSTLKVISVSSQFKDCVATWARGEPNLLAMWNRVVQCCSSFKLFETSDVNSGMNLTFTGVIQYFRGHAQENGQEEVCDTSFQLKGNPFSNKKDARSHVLKIFVEGVTTRLLASPLESDLPIEVEVSHTVVHDKIMSILDRRPGQTVGNLKYHHWLIPTTKKQLNSVLYELERGGFLRKDNSTPPRWYVVGNSTQELRRELATVITAIPSDMGRTSHNDQNPGAVTQSHPSKPVESYLNLVDLGSALKDSPMTPIASGSTGVAPFWKHLGHVVFEVGTKDVILLDCGCGFRIPQNVLDSSVVVGFADPNYQGWVPDNFFRFEGSTKDGADHTMTFFLGGISMMQLWRKNKIFLISNDNALQAAVDLLVITGYDAKKLTTIQARERFERVRTSHNFETVSTNQIRSYFGL